MSECRTAKGKFKRCPTGRRAGSTAAYKAKYKRQIMDKLEGTYTRNSGPYKTVQKSLNKLSENELSSLSAMLTTIRSQCRR